MPLSLLGTADSPRPFVHDSIVNVHETLEWWPDYGGHLLFLRAGPGGHPVDTATVGLSTDLTKRLASWTADYSDAKLPAEGDGDEVWLAAGRALLAETRNELEGRYSVVVTEPWWGEPAAE